MEGLRKKWRMHGISVNQHYSKLIQDPTIINNDKVIAWFEQYVPIDLSMYHIHHDISKPYVETMDAYGKLHYDNHSYHSHLKYIELFGHDEFADMILHDMDFHTKRGDDITTTWQLPYSPHLYATAWAEVFANAELFGGTDSTSFKIKKKKLIKSLNRRPCVATP